MLSWTTYILPLLLVGTLHVAAQSSAISTVSAPPGIPTPSACILGCVGPAAIQNGCGSFANITCICTSAQFQEDSRECLEAECPNDIQAALALQSAECGAVHLSATGTATSGTFLPSNSAAETSSAASVSKSGSTSSGSKSASTTGSVSSTGSTSSSATPTAPSSSGSGSASVTGGSSSSSPSPTKSNAAMGKVDLFGMGGTAAVVIGLVGAAAGALVV